MKDCYIILPVYNDWKSLNLLLSKINSEIKNRDEKFNILIINDFSSEKPIVKKNFRNIHKIKVINLKKNIGSQKAILVALKYIKKKKYNSIISIMDSDGEDDPKKLLKLINFAKIFKNHIIVANRNQRRENLYLRFLNKVRLIFTWALTGKYINFGNFSSFLTSNLDKVLSNNNIWLAYSGAIAKNCKNILSINTKKEKRYHGLSKVNFAFLITHSLKIISIFNSEIFFRSIIFFFLINILIEEKILLIIIIFLINIFFFSINKFSQLKSNSQKLIKNITNVKN